MKVFVDTSALYALIFPEDAHHQRAVACFEALTLAQRILVSTNYVLLECASLLQRRHGFTLAHTFLEKTAELLDVIWIGEKEHRAGVSLWTKAASRQLSLVDCSSIAVMREHGLREAVAFDRHFAEAGFNMLPATDRVAEPRGRYRAGRQPIKK